MTAIGIIGFGLMGRTHLNAYLRDGRARIHAIADPHTEKLELGEIESNFGGDASKFDIGSIVHHTSAAALINDSAVDAISICTPTGAHVDLAIAALQAGKHVLVEKPLGLTSTDAGRAVDAASDLPKLVAMPAMCMRFWPAWRWLKGAIADGRYGAVESAVFTRVGPMPGWASFYANADESGGAILDLHIHDVDFIRFCFGDPIAITATGRSLVSGGIDHVVAHFHYRNGPEIVVAEGGWNADPDAAFTMRYLVHFERGTARFDFGTQTELTVTVDGESTDVDVPAGTGYEREITAFLDAIATGEQSSLVTMHDGAEAVRVIEAERVSIESGGPVTFSPVLEDA